MQTFTFEMILGLLETEYYPYITFNQFTLQLYQPIDNKPIIFVQLKYTYMSVFIFIHAEI